MFWWTWNIPKTELGPARSPLPPGLDDSLIATPEPSSPGGRIPTGQEYREADPTPRARPAVTGRFGGAPTKKVPGAKVPKGILPLAGRLSGNPLLALVGGLLDSLFGGRQLEKTILHPAFIETPYGPSGGSPLLAGNTPPDSYLLGNWSSSDEEGAGGEVETPSATGAEGTEEEPGTQPEDPGDPDTPEDMGGGWSAL